MVLEPLPAPRSGEEKPENCTGLPVVSTVGNLGIGSAVLYVEFVRRDDTTLEARCMGKPCYLAMASLPTGWSAQPSAQEEERTRKVAVTAERKRDPSLGRFLDGSKACLSKKDVPACLAPFVSEQFQPGLSPDWEVYGETSHPLPPEAGPGRARAVIDYIWSTEAREWVERCIRHAPAGDLQDSTELFVSLPESFRYCTIRKEGAVWRLVEVGATE